MIANKKARKSALNATETVDSDGILVDVDVQSIEDGGKSRSDRTRDISAFFDEPIPHKGKNGQTQLHRKCKLCP